MKKRILILLLITNFTTFSREENCDNYMSNIDFESNAPNGIIQNNINDAIDWSPIWGSFYSGEFCTFDNYFPSLTSSTPASGNYSEFWICNQQNGEREGIMNQLQTSIPYGNQSFELSFDICVLTGYGIPEIGVYGAYKPSATVSSLVTSGNSQTPSNLDLFGQDNVVLLATISISQTDNIRQEYSIDFTNSSSEFPTNGISHLFFTRTDSIFSAKKHIGIDNFCLSDRD
jgi:hypothetical protein